MLQLSAVEPGTLDCLNEVMNLDYLQNFYLVGGTALALQIGHRLSEDLDLFTLESFDYQKLLDKLSQTFLACEIVNESDNTLMVKLRGVKVDFIRYNYRLLQPVIVEENIRMWSKQDIAAMKLSAIAGRGAKKDFYDLYFLLQEFSIAELFDFYKQKYNQQQVFHLVRSIQYFDDAEGDIDPVVFNKLRWVEVKSFIEKSVNDYLRNI
jgi:predicted nucleotidyltransferase component of viral defense system